MANQIVKQPNGKYAIYSSSVDDFIAVDCENIQEIVDFFVESEKRFWNDRVRRIVGMLNNGEFPYGGSMTMSFQDCVNAIREIHGSDAESLKMLGVK